MAAADNPISPNHYARFKIQPLAFIMANGLGFCVGNVIKYVCRYDAKNGLEDLKKARNYLDKLIEQEEKKAAKGAIPTDLANLYKDALARAELTDFYRRYFF